jgi:hypothetical protein
MEAEGKRRGWKKGSVEEEKGAGRVNRSNLFYLFCYRLFLVPSCHFLSPLNGITCGPVILSNSGTCHYQHTGPLAIFGNFDFRQGGTA